MAFTFQLERADGTLADPLTIVLVVYKPGDQITLGAGRSLRVIDVDAAAAASRDTYPSCRAAWQRRPQR